MSCWKGPSGVIQNGKLDPEQAKRGAWVGCGEGLHPSVEWDSIPLEISSAMGGAGIF